MTRSESSRRRISKWTVLTLMLALIPTAGGDFFCGDGPCVDGIQGDGLTDFNDGTAEAIRLINRSQDFIHLIGVNETADFCNQLNLGDGRFIFVSIDAISFRVRAFLDGVLLDQIVCSLPEETEVTWDGDELTCVNLVL